MRESYCHPACTLHACASSRLYGAVVKAMSVTCFTNSAIGVKSIIIAVIAVINILAFVLECLFISFISLRKQTLGGWSFSTPRTRQGTLTPEDKAGQRTTSCPTPLHLVTFHFVVVKLLFLLYLNIELYSIYYSYQ